MSPRNLRNCILGAGIASTVDVPEDLAVTGVAEHTGSVTPGSLFVCMPSTSRDTHAFLGPARQAGAAAAVVHSQDGLEAAQAARMPAVRIEGEGIAFNLAIGRLCREVLGDPSTAMRLLGVTGTNGKTTTAWIVRHALDSLGVRCAYLGTLGYGLGEESRTLENTTPFPVTLWNLLAEARSQGAQVVSMEVSSHALHGRRLGGVSFSVGCFTNLTQDHLDYHGSMEEYKAAKLLFFTEMASASRAPFRAAVNLGDPTGREWLDSIPVPVLTYGAADASLVTEGREVAVDGCTLSVPGVGSVRTRLGGAYNVENLSSALAMLVAFGVPVSDALAALRDVPSVPGRFEAVPNEIGIGVLVDYAHTPDALAALLRCVRELGPPRIVTVFGCGGDRDRTKRPLMAAAASKNSDLCVLTSDNPRTEDPEAIIAEAASGLDPGSEAVTIVDRRAAIEYAVEAAEPGDVVVIAGKGHEDYQIIGRTKHPMSDRQMAKDALEARRCASR